MSDRAEFEVAYKKAYGFNPSMMMSWNGEHYKYGEEIRAWGLWQASRAQALDEILKIDVVFCNSTAYQKYKGAMQLAVIEFKTAIKELKEQP